VFVSSHLIGELARTADRVVVIGRGRLLADTSVAELAAGSASLEAAFFELTDGSTDHRGRVPGGRGAAPLPADRRTS
jgi:ABC-2 type transport system ATP-binding protein